MAMEQPKNRFVTPVVGINGAAVRPGELLVPLDRKPTLEQMLQRENGRPYGPDALAEKDDWRRLTKDPDGPEVNERLRKYGFELWVGFLPVRTIHLVSRLSTTGLRHNQVFIGGSAGDFYHGGPDGAPVPATGPTRGVVTRGNSEGAADIAVLDTGLPTDWFATHPGMKATLTRFVQQFPDDPLDENKDKSLDAQAGHGPFICGLIARAAPTFDVQLRRALRSTGEGDEAKLIPVLHEVADTPARVVNLSFGGHTVHDEEPICAVAIRELINRSKIVVAAAGNDGGTEYAARPFYPAAHPEVVAVGGYDSRTGKVAPTSHAADIFAPSRDLVSSYVSGWPVPDSNNNKTFAGWASWSGTSFATPLVAARMAQLAIEHNVHDTAKLIEIWKGTGELHEAPDWPRKPGVSGPALRYVPTTDFTVWQ